MSNNSVKLNQVKNKIYRYFNKAWGNLYHDEAWENVNEALDGICQNVDEVENINVSGGKYFNYLTNSENPPYRDYNFLITTQFGNIEGYLRCCAAGKFDDPFSRYDMVISLWNSDKSVDESIKKNLHNLLEAKKQETVIKSKIKTIVNEEIGRIMEE